MKQGEAMYYNVRLSVIHVAKLKKIVQNSKTAAIRRSKFTIRRGITPACVRV